MGVGIWPRISSNPEQWRSVKDQTQSLWEGKEQPQSTVELAVGSCRKLGSTSRSSPMVRWPIDLSSDYKEVWVRFESISDSFLSLIRIGVSWDFKCDIWARLFEFQGRKFGDRESESLIWEIVSFFLIIEILVAPVDVHRSEQIGEIILYLVFIVACAC